jgi:hypothetical protein
LVSEDGALGEMEAVVSAAGRDGDAPRWAADGTGGIGVSALPDFGSRFRREASLMCGCGASAWGALVLASDAGVLVEIDAVVSVAAGGRL